MGTTEEVELNADETAIFKPYFKFFLINNISLEEYLHSSLKIFFNLRDTTFFFKNVMVLTLVQNFALKTWLCERKIILRPFFLHRTE